MMSFKIFFVLLAGAAASRKQNPGVSPKCQDEVKSIQTKSKAAAVTACEEKAKYPQQAITHLQNGDKAAAVSTIEESFQKCAKFSEGCAKELAPAVIQQLQFSGAAVADTCKQAVQKVQSDKEKMKQVAMCELQEKVAESVLAALNKGEIDSAVGAAQQGLQKCMGLSETCASQLAPVVVNQVVMRALAEQQQKQGQGGAEEAPMTTVFANATSATVLASKTTEKLSLVGMAVDQRVPVKFSKKSSQMSFLQKDHKTVRLPQRFVSRMIMQFAH